MIHEHPLAYLLGLEGLALMRGFTGELDRDFVESRIAEVRRLLDDESLATAAVDVERVKTVEGYRIWSETYDQPGNAAFLIDEPEVSRIVDQLLPGAALDAACGTGRYAQWLSERGHRVIGVDSSPEMLARARARVPRGEFLLGDLRRLPVGDSEVDLVVCGLALTHLPVLEPVIAEFARVLRPGGHLVIADVHPEAVARGSIPPVRRADGRPGRVISHRHRIGDYLRAALSAGLRLRGCEEPRAVEPGSRGQAATTTGPWDVWPWSLAAMVPEAARAANEGVPAMVVFHFEQADS
ncbi:methyltransferase [Prauserella marina]|uniref:Methyltransferase domain-containing protein n=1 Tax=Prauserella marina TaxID=530584 RepID=A0A222VW38_9PSEU|nr:class I SAM-dependent methyltransferase [Prauserella marina]ASR38100.1 methyltransferase [Prauserella marina]PWV78742.1 methyltransferase family protein [Prauserella marina]SDC92642.1 Methyltransferase domain-containing protein [Prauserella marina]